MTNHNLKMRVNIDFSKPFQVNFTPEQLNKDLQALVTIVDEGTGSKTPSHIIQAKIDYQLVELRNKYQINLNFTLSETDPNMVIFTVSAL